MCESGDMLNLGKCVPTVKKSDVRKRILAHCTLIFGPRSNRLTRDWLIMSIKAWPSRPNKACPGLPSLA